MDAKTLEGMINDPAIPDNEVFEATWEFLSEKFDASGKKIARTTDELTEIQRLGELTDRKRPLVMQKIANAKNDPHYFCCGPGRIK